MSRESAFLQMLEASARIQRDIAQILDAQAEESAKSRNWVCIHAVSAAFRDHEHQLSTAIGIQEQMVSVINGLAKLEYGLAKNLKVVLGYDESGSDMGFGGLGGNLEDFFDSDAGKEHGH